MNRLAVQGHNVIVLSTNLDPSPPPNVHYIHLENVYDYIYNDLELIVTAFSELNTDETVYSLSEFAMASCAGVQKSINGLQTLLNYPNDFKFDLVKYDFTMGPCILGFLHKFNYPPLLSFTACNVPYISRLVGGHNYFSYIPFFTSQYLDDMDFWQRAHNLYLYALEY